jgi:predicted RNA binding protein YcfA (HicA-like mRNA interferase family)
MAGLFRAAMADVAETLRRAFKDPPPLGVELALERPGSGTVPFPSTSAVAPPWRPEAVLGQVPMLEPLPPVQVGFEWIAQVCNEEAWAAWAAGAQVFEMEVFRAEACARLEMEPLPRGAEVRSAGLEGFRTRVRPGFEAVPGTRTRAADCGIPPPRARRSLVTALALPVAFRSEDISRIPKNLWMRYSLKLVKETGENIRNLEVLGLYRIPLRGSHSINHQATTGRLLVSMGPEAQGSPRAPFILARKKDDDSIVCCFVEDA